MRRNRLTYALPLACLLATGAAGLAMADDTPAGASGDPAYGSSSGRQGQMDAAPSQSQSGDSMSSDTQSSSGSAAMNDAAITAKVKSALLAERGLPSSQISVETNDGVVQLSGFLNSQSEIDRAVQVTRNVKDVKSVENNMQTK